MKKELNELANQLQTLAANYEEAVRPTMTWDTLDWRDALENLYQESKQMVDLRGEPPLVVVHEMFMHLSEAWEEIERIHGRRNPPRNTQRALDDAVAQMRRQRDEAAAQMQRDMAGTARFFDWPMAFTGTAAPQLAPLERIGPEDELHDGNDHPDEEDNPF